MRALARFVSPLLLAAVLPHVASTQRYDPVLYAALRWRLIGPFRGGRTVAAVGVPGQPNLFYVGVNDGGVWKTTDYGRTWIPIFDDQPTGSIGALAAAPSDPRVLYVGSGEGLQRPDLSVGDGVYKSTDGGSAWRHLGLRDGQQIPAILVDPRDPNRVFVAVLGHPYGPNEERGVFRSTDGGETWQKVLYKDDNTGGVDLAFDAANPQTVFAVLWAARQAPWEIGSSWTLAARNGLYKSTDGGTTWRQLTGGLPGADDGLGRIGLGFAASAAGRVYAVLGAKRGGGLYRSDDGGEHWRFVNGDERLWGRDGDFNEVKVDPTNPDVVYVANVVTWKSSDGGQTFTAFRGAPGGDDYHRLWIDPAKPNVILLAGDQGAIVTVNGGATWSSWYNQPTAQFYHVVTDNRFPYWVYGGQQESGSAGVASRGNDGQVTVREWHPVGVEEYGYVAPDPLHPNLIYGGKISRFDWATGQVQDVSPEPVRMGKYRAHPAILPHPHRLGRHVLDLARGPVEAADLSAVNQVGVQRVWGHVAVLLDAHGMPLPDGDLAVVAAARDARRSALLLPAVDPVRKTVIGDDVIELGRGLVVPRAPGRAAVHRHDRALVAGEEDDVGLGRIDPEPMVVVPARGAAKRGERLPPIAGLPSHDVRHVDDVGIGRIDLHFVEVAVATPQPLVAVDEPPVLAAVVGAVQAAAPLRAQHGVHAAGRARGEPEPDATQAVVSARQAPGELPPRGPAVRGLVEAVLGRQRPRAADLPRRLARGPQHGEHRLWTRGVQRHVHGAGILVGVEHLLPRRAPIARAEHAALRVRAVRVPQHRREHPVGIPRIDHDRRDLLAVPEPEMAPRGAAVRALVDPVPDRQIGALQPLAAPHVDGPRVGRD